MAWWPEPRGGTVKAGEVAAGVSVIIPSQGRGSGLQECLASLGDQSLDMGLLDVVVVLNGADAPDAGRWAKVAGKLSPTSVRFLRNDEPGAGRARNVGLDAATRAYVTFLDDDDTLEPDFLAGMLRHAQPERIVVAPIVDVAHDGVVHRGTSLNQRIGALAGRGQTRLSTAPWVLGFNACKLIPVGVARSHRYPCDLRSGEDVAYMAGLLTSGPLAVLAVEDTGDNAYRRRLTAGSVSRRTPEFTFSVLERLEVIRHLTRLQLPGSSPEAAARDALARSQASFVQRFLEANPGEEERTLDAIEEAHVDFPWEVLNSGKARDLVISYCFAPDMDTSAVVAAKAVRQRGKLVDVIANDMGKSREKDDTLRLLSARFVDHLEILRTRPAFNNWKSISEFAIEALRVAEARDAKKGGYRSLYSRALWPGSHVGAALFKLRHWSVRWTAEFSDPLRLGALGERRLGSVDADPVADELDEALRARGYRAPVETLFDLVEFSTYALADDFVFTNPAQRDSMLSLLPDQRLATRVLQRSVVRSHPMAPDWAYSAVPSSYRLADDVVNIAYFGNFYPNRTLNEVLVGLANLDDDDRRVVRLHVFCNKPEEVLATADRVGVGDRVAVNPYLSHLEYLNALTRFDVLIVNDVSRPQGLPVNPFLPSKVADYLGAGSDVWALVDEGSQLSGMHFPYVSAVGDYRGATEVLGRIARRSPIALHDGSEGDSGRGGEARS